MESVLTVASPRHSLPLSGLSPTAFSHVRLPPSHGPGNKDPIAIYTGWGAASGHRNVGDELCDAALRLLLTERKIDNLWTARSSAAPVLEQWEGPLLIGGGTVLPGVFKQTIAPGLSSASPIFIFGSGCLSPPELRNRRLSVFGIEEIHRAHLIGTRGPLSSKYFQTYYGRTIPFVGDLAFAFARPSPLPVVSDQLSFFLIEHPMRGSRLCRSSHEILGLYGALCREKRIGAFTKALCLTDDPPPIAQIRKKAPLFDVVEQPTSPGDFVSVIARSRLVVTERLHPAIIAACLGVPFLYLQTTSKSRDVEHLLRKVSKRPELSKCFIDMEQPRDSLLPRLLFLLADRELPEELCSVSSQVRQRLRNGAEMLAERMESLGALAGAPRLPL